MEDEKNKQTEEEINEENDAREEDVVEDTDSDTKDIEKNDNADFKALSARFDRLESLVERLTGNVEALRDAQGIMIDNGATVQESSMEDMDLDDDGFVSTDELDLLLS